MNNEIIWFSFLFFDFFFLIAALVFFGLHGLYAVIVIGIIICNIQVLTIIDIFGLQEAFGNITYGGTFLASGLINELYGKKAAQRGVMLGFAALLFFITAIQVTIRLQPSSVDTVHSHIVQLFAQSPRIIAASLIAYLISQCHDVWAYRWWYNKTNGKHLWLRNNAATMLSQLLDTGIFTCIAFYGVYSVDTMMNIFSVALGIKWLVAICDTPFIYLGKWLHKKNYLRDAILVN